MEYSLDFVVGNREADRSHFSGQNQKLM